MLTVLMNHIFVLAIEIFIGFLLAGEIFQKQLNNTIWQYQVCEYLREINNGDNNR